MKLNVEILEVLESTVRLLLGNSLTSLEPANCKLWRSAAYEGRPGHAGCVSPAWKI